MQKGARQLTAAAKLDHYVARLKSERDVIRDQLEEVLAITAEPAPLAFDEAAARAELA